MSTVARIVVVDDEPLIAHTCAKILRLHGFECEAFSDPEAALRYLRHHCPDLLLTDLIMPGLTGMELAAQLKLIHPDCNVLILSGIANMLDSGKLHAYSTFDVELLQKPIHPLELIAAIRRLELRVR